MSTILTYFLHQYIFYTFRWRGRAIDVPSLVLLLVLGFARVFENEEEDEDDSLNRARDPPMWFFSEINSEDPTPIHADS
jgi:hypothetical protein